MAEVQDPFEILEGMREIALADMMDNVGYVSTRIDRPERADSICRGHRACAVGSAWLAAGVSLRRIKGLNHSYCLPGVEQGKPRARFLARRPALRRAFDVLNATAEEYINRHHVIVEGTYEAPIEALFESEDEQLDGDNRRRVMLRVIATAKRKLKAPDGAR